MSDLNYQASLNSEAHGHIDSNPCRLTGAHPRGNGFAIIDSLVATLPPFPFSEREIEALACGGMK